MAEDLYYCTSENLKSITEGLEVSENDDIISYGGSGEQALALLEHSQSVSVFDLSERQREIIERKTELIRDGRYKDFLFFGMDESPNRFYEFLMMKRRRYFTEERLEKIRSKLGNLTLLPYTDLSDIFQGNNMFTRAYLSNMLNEKNLRDKGKLEALGYISERILPLGLIYVSNHSELLHGSNGNRLEDRNDLDNFEFLPSNLRLDQRLSRLARKHPNGIWKPAIYKKI